MPNLVNIKKKNFAQIGQFKNNSDVHIILRYSKLNSYNFNSNFRYSCFCQIQIIRFEINLFLYAVCSAYLKMYINVS